MSEAVNQTEFSEEVPPYFQGDKSKIRKSKNFLKKKIKKIFEIFFETTVKKES